jgi:hypothetical protein
VYANRRRLRGARGQRLIRQQGELIERSFAYLFDGWMRRVDAGCRGLGSITHCPPCVDFHQLSSLPALLSVDHLYHGLLMLLFYFWTKI